MKKLFFLSLLLLIIPLLATADEPTITINEIAWMGTNISANAEWLELKNNASGDIDLTGWRLEAADGSPKINLIGNLPASGFFILERTSDDTLPQITADQIYTGSLGNTGEWLKLYDAAGNLIDKINATDGWPGGDNQTKATLQRLNQSSWQTSPEIGGTPKATNIAATPPDPITPDQTPGETTPADSVAAPAAGTELCDLIKTGDIIFNEVLPNPVGTDNNNEFIELKNVSQATINLTDWKISNTAKQIFILPSIIMSPKSIVALDRRQTNLALNNTKEKITLICRTGKTINQLSYAAAPEGLSYQVTADGPSGWGPVSLGQENTLKIEPAPTAVITGPKEATINEVVNFDASDSFDPQNRPLKYFWDFGDGRTAEGMAISQIYLTAKTFTVVLNVSCNQFASSTANWKIKITDPAGNSANNTTTATTTELSMVNQNSLSAEEINLAPAVIISEFLPNPNGEDQPEFIEIFNQENYAVDLSRWQIQDASGKAYNIPTPTVILPQQFLAFFKPTTKLALNDNGDTIRLFNAAGQLLDQVAYKKTIKGNSFVLDQNFVWQQTSTPTPGQDNAWSDLNFADQAEITEDENTADTSTGKILGAQMQDYKNLKPTTTDLLILNNRRYLIAGALAIGALILGGIWRLKKIKLTN